VSLFLGKDFVLTFQEDPGDCLDPIRERLRTGAGHLRREGADYLMYAILDAIIDGYFPFLESFGETVEDLEDAVVERPTRATLARVHEVRRDLLNVRRCIWPLRDVVNGLVRDETPLIGKNTRLYLRDCAQHTVYILDVIETYRELTASLMDVYVSSVSNRLNEVMKVLTVIATIFMPLTFLAGVYGMNFNTSASPYNMPELNWRWGYVACWAVMFLIALLMLVLFRRKGWLGGGTPDESPDAKS
jgi:magnesium transporter